MSLETSFAYIALMASLISLAIIIYLVYVFKKELVLARSLLRRKFSSAFKKPNKLRKRYIVFSVISGEKLSKKEIEESIRKKIGKIYGIIGVAKTDPQVVFYDPSIKKGIIRTSHKEKELVIAALSLVREINGKKALIIPLKTTGTIKKAKKYMYSIKK